MNFITKNFQYRTETFKEFMLEAKSGGKVYLRALSSTEPADAPADLGHDFPSLSRDFVLPPELAFVSENLFSSVLRISGQVNMWLHYDVSGTHEATGSATRSASDVSMPRLGYGERVLPDYWLQEVSDISPFRREPPWLCTWRIEFSHRCLLHRRALDVTYPAARDNPITWRRSTHPPVVAACLVSSINSQCCGQRILSRP